MKRNYFLAYSQVHYEPGLATLTHFPLIAVKKKSVTFSCSVDDPGYPESNRFVKRSLFIQFHTLVAIAYNHKTLSNANQLNALCFMLKRDVRPTSKRTLLTSLPPSLSSLSPQPTFRLQKMGNFSYLANVISYRNRYRWFRGGRGPLQDVVTKDWTVEPVGLDSRTNYSCYAYNDGGHGSPATVNLEVHAPPFFIKNLFPYTGILYSSRNASLMCRIECVPRCAIAWLKDGVSLEENNGRYFVKEEYMAASPATGDFESVMSVLVRTVRVLLKIKLHTCIGVCFE